MSPSLEQIAQIEDYASSFFSPQEIAIIMDLNTPEFILLFTTEGAVKNAYNKGRLIQEAKLRKVILELATKGSSPAQTLAMDIIKNSKLNNIPI
jgi:hypothetical protein